MCSEWNKAESRFRKLGIDHLHLPTSDFQLPSLDLIEKGVAFIEKNLNDKKMVYVHCKAGRGRSATVVLCWLLSKGNIMAKQAQEILLQKRPHVNPNLYQKDVVQQFQANLS